MRYLIMDYSVFIRAPGARNCSWICRLRSIPSHPKDIGATLNSMTAEIRRCCSSSRIDPCPVRRTGILVRVDGGSYAVITTVCVNTNSSIPIRGCFYQIPVSCIFRPSESKETVGVSPPSREKQVQVHGRESTGVLFGKKWQRNASQSAPPRVIYSDWNPFLLRMESSPSMRIL